MAKENEMPAVTEMSSDDYIRILDGSTSKRIQWPDFQLQTGGLPAASDAETIAGTSAVKSLTPAGRTAALPYLDARTRGVVGGGVNTTTALQDCLDEAETWLQHDGAFFPDREPRVILPPNDYYTVSGITIPQGVVLDLRGGELRATAGITTLVTLDGDRSGICNGFLEDLTLSADTTGVRILGFQCQVDNVFFNKFGGPAIRVEKNAARINQVIAQNCCLSADTFSAPTGVLHVDTLGNDIWVTNCEVGASRTAMSASGFAYAVVAHGQMGNYHGVVGEVSDHGWHVGGGTPIGNKFTACRGELNRGHGWVFAGGAGMVIGCHAWNNGRETTNTYDGFNVNQFASGSANQPQYQFVACRAEITAGNTHKYGFNDTAANGGFFSTYTACRSTGHGTRAIATVTANGGHVTPDSGSFTAITAAATTWDVQSYGWPHEKWEFVNTGAVNFTYWTNGVPGMRLTIFGDGFTTMVHNATFLKLLSGANTLAAAGVIYEFVWRNSCWIQI